MPPPAESRSPLGLAIDRLTRYRTRMEQSLGEFGASLPAFGAALDSLVEPAAAASAARLGETVAFGDNPGRLRMLSYVPADLPPGAPLVVVLHGCRQSAEGFDHASAWSVLAERHRFALLVPEQRRGNSALLCFNWFRPADIAPGLGEVGSIRQMVGAMVERHRLDPARVFATGLSAGGAMAAALLSCHPDVFAAGAIVAGVAFGAATGTSEALDCMAHGPKLPPAALAERIRAASPAARRWPRVSIWQGDADQIVTAANATALVGQWAVLHGAREAERTREPGLDRQLWRDARGEITVEQVWLPGFGHGLPIDVAGGLGHAAPFMLDIGVSAPALIARGWGIA